MKRRILWIELRRSAAFWLGPLMLVVGLAIGYASPADWAGRWMALARLFRSAMFLLWPLALAGGAWQARRERRCRVEELFATVPRPAGRRRAMSALAPALTVVAGYLGAVLGAGAVMAAPTASYFPPDVVVIVAVGALSLLAMVWVGAGIGRALPSLLTAPALAIAGFAGLFATAVVSDREVFQSDPAPRFALLSPVLRTMWGDACTVAGRVSAAQAIWLGCLAAAGFGLVTASRRRSAVASAAVAVAGTALALALLPAGGASAAYPVDRHAAALVCSPDAPRVCVRRVHARLLGEVTPPARRALALLAKLPDPPAAAQEAIRPKWLGNGGRPPAAPGTVLFEVGFDATGGLEDPDAVVDSVLAGAGTAPCRASAGESLDDNAARDVAAAWLKGREPTGGLTQWDAMLLPIYRDLTALAPQEQVRRVAALRRAALACEPDLTRALRGKAP